MTIYSGIFNSVRDSNGNGDRKYNAWWFAKYFSMFIGNGVFPNPSTNLQVVSNENMKIVVKPGNGWIDGYFIYSDGDHVLQLDVADGVLKRIDRIVMRLDYLNRKIDLVVKKGIFASSPVAPTLQRDTDYVELALADVLINNGATQITQANITDQRFNKTLCGIVKGTIDEIDTTGLFAQYGKAFEEWFENLQTELQGDVAANLQLQIDRLVRKMDSIAIQYGIDTGTTNAKIVTIDNPPPTYFDGMAIAFKNKVENTGSVTINVNGLGVKTIKKGNGRTLSNGNLKANVPYTIRYNGVDFFLSGEGGVGTAKPEDVVKDKTFTNDEGEQVGTLKVYNSGEKIPTSKVTAGYRSQWANAPIDYAGAFRPAVDKDGNVYTTNAPDNRNGNMVVVAKFSPTGALIKKVSVSDPNRYAPSGVAVNGDYVVFTTGGTHTTSINVYNLNLDLITTIPLGTSYYNSGKAVAVTTKGDIYICVGKYSSGSSNTYELKKISKSGYFYWSKLFDRENLMDVILLSDGNIAVASDYLGYRVRKINGIDNVPDPNILWTYDTSADNSTTRMGNIAELTNGDVAVSYGRGSSDGKQDCWVQKIMPNGTARPGGYIALTGRLGVQYMGVANICSDGNNGIYFGFSGYFNWYKPNNTSVQVSFLIFGRWSGDGSPLPWCHIYSQDDYWAYNDAIWGMAYDPLSDSVFSTHSSSSANGNVRKWDWYVSLK